MSWQLLIIIQAVLAAFSIITVRKLAKDPRLKQASFMVNAGWYVIMYGFGILCLPLLGHFHSPHLLSYWWRFIGGGVAFTLTNVLTYKMLTYFDAAIGTLLGTMNVLFTILGAALFLHENLSLLQIVGAVVLLFGVLYATLLARSAKIKKAQRHIVFKGLACGIGAALFYAVAIVNEKSLLGLMSLASYVVFGWGGQTIMAVILGLALQPKKIAVVFKSRYMGWLAATGILRSICGICFMLSQIRSNNVALVTVISNSRIIVVVILGVLILKERQKLVQKCAAAGMAFIGLGIMFWK